jgi:hypothetical protein
MHQYYQSSHSFVARHHYFTQTHAASLGHSSWLVVCSGRYIRDGNCRHARLDCRLASNSHHGIAVKLECASAGIPLAVPTICTLSDELRSDQTRSRMNCRCIRSYPAEHWNERYCPSHRSRCESSEDRLWRSEYFTSLQLGLRSPSIRRRCEKLTPRPLRTKRQFLTLSRYEENGCEVHLSLVNDPASSSSSLMPSAT